MPTPQRTYPAVQKNDVGSQPFWRYISAPSANISRPMLTCGGCVRRVRRSAIVRSSAHGDDEGIRFDNVRGSSRRVEGGVCRGTHAQQQEDPRGIRVIEGIIVVVILLSATHHSNPAPRGSPQTQLGLVTPIFQRFPLSCRTPGEPDPPDGPGRFGCHTDAEIREKLVSPDKNARGTWMVRLHGREGSYVRGQLRCTLK